MTEWWELSEEARIKEFYSKYTISDFFNWWSGNSNELMEVRIKDYPLIKEVAEKLSIGYGISGVYVNNGDDLRRVIALVRDKATVWCGINPRKYNWGKFGKKNLAGDMHHVKSINFLFIDIDRIIKLTQAANNELHNANILADKILEKLGQHGFANNYCKICSGNGVQLLIKLDYAIKMPEVEYDLTTKTYKPSFEFEQHTSLIKAKIGKQLLNFSNRFKEELGVTLDRACFNIAGVGALPATKNYKYGGYTWRGIVEIKADGENIGLTDYIMQGTEAVIKENIFAKPKKISNVDMLIKGKLREHPLVKFMLQKLPPGEPNNKLFFSFKCLVRDSKIDITSEEFMQLHKDIETAWNDKLTLNMPERKFTFSRNTVNSYCVDNLIPPIYPLWENRIGKRPVKIENITFDAAMMSTQPLLPLLANTTIEEDMNMFDGMLKDNDYGNIDLYAQFIKACMNKYGEQKIKYYVQYVFPRFFCWK